VVKALQIVLFAWVGLAFMGWEQAALAQDTDAVAAALRRDPPLIDILDTALDPWITDNDTVNRTLYTRLAFDIQIIKPRRVSRKRGFKIKSGFETYYLYVIRFKEMTVNGYPVKPQQMITFREVEVRSQSTRPSVRLDAANASTQIDSSQAQTRGNRRQNQANGGRNNRQGRKNRRNRTSAPAVSTAPAQQPPQPRAAPAPADSTQPAGNSRRNRNSRNNRRNRRNANPNDSIADITVSNQPPERQVRIEQESKDLYYYMVVVSRRKRLKKNPDEFYSRAMFLKGIVDRLDSLPEFRRMYEEQLAEMDSLRQVFASNGNTIPADQEQAFRVRANKLHTAYHRYKLYSDLKKYRRKKRKIIKKFFLGKHFYSTNLEFNIRPMPYALPEIRYLWKKPRQVAEEPPQDQQIYYRYGIQTFKEQKQKKKRTYKKRYSNEVQTRPMPLDQLYASEETDRGNIFQRLFGGLFGGKGSSGGSSAGAGGAASPASGGNNPPQGNGNERGNRRSRRNADSAAPAPSQPPATSEPPIGE
jgi:hypothetical protein